LIAGLRFGRDDFRVVGFHEKAGQINFSFGRSRRQLIVDQRSREGAAFLPHDTVVSIRLLSVITIL
jgi:hypothetical protein